MGWSDLISLQIINKLAHNDVRWYVTDNQAVKFSRLIQINNKSLISVGSLNIGMGNNQLNILIVSATQKNILVV